MNQLFSYDVYHFKDRLCPKSKVDLSIAKVLSWANQKVQAVGKSTQIKSIDDTSLKTCIFFIDLLYSLDPLSVNYGLVTPGITGKLFHH